VVYLKVAEGYEQDQIIPTFAELRYKFKLTGANSEERVGALEKKIPDVRIKTHFLERIRVKLAQF